MALRAVAINCSLKGSGGDEDSSTDKMIEVVATHLAARGVEFVETIRIADHDVKPGVESDMGGGDQWPGIRARILDARRSGWGRCRASPSGWWSGWMDAFLGETDDRGRMPSYSKVAVLAVVGNEDGGHAVSSQLYQALNDTGWTIPAAAVSYWTGEAMAKIDFKDLDQVPDKVRETAAMVAANAAHLAGLLKAAPYPGGD